MGRTKYVIKRIKFLLRKYFNKMHFYRNREMYKRLKDKSCSKRLLLLGTPEYGNLGDHAIAIAEKEFLKQYFPEYELIEITQENLIWDEKGVFQNIRENDILLYTGGGFIGSMYLHTGGGVLRKVMERFLHNPIVVLPSTVYYDETDSGQDIKKEDFSLWSKCSDLHLFLRDIHSFRMCSEEVLPCVTKHLMYDMVFSMKWNKEMERKGVKIVLRADAERVQQIDCKELEQIITQLGHTYDYSSTRVDHDVLPENRDAEVYKKLEEFASAELVITDRLHGMIFSIITKTPCIALDNRSRKLSGVLSVIEAPDYVLMSTAESITTDLKKVLLSDSKSYDFKVPDFDYSALKKCIEDILEG